jgi:hypothetical protein
VGIGEEKAGGVAKKGKGWWEVAVEGKVYGSYAGELSMDANREQPVVDLEGGELLRSGRREAVGEKNLVGESTALIPLCHDPNWI